MSTGDQFVAKQYVRNPEENWTINMGDTLYLYEEVSNGSYVIGFNAFNNNTGEKMYLGGDDILYLTDGYES